MRYTSTKNKTIATKPTTKNSEKRPTHPTHLWSKKKKKETEEEKTMARQPTMCVLCIAYTTCTIYSDRKSSYWPTRKFRCGRCLPKIDRGLSIYIYGIWSYWFFPFCVLFRFFSFFFAIRMPFRQSLHRIPGYYLRCHRTIIRPSNAPNRRHESTAWNSLIFKFFAEWSNSNACQRKSHFNLIGK